MLRVCVDAAEVLGEARLRVLLRLWLIVHAAERQSASGTSYGTAIGGYVLAVTGFSRRNLLRASPSLATYPFPSASTTPTLSRWVKIGVLWGKWIQDLASNVMHRVVTLRSEASQATNAPEIADLIAKLVASDSQPHFRDVGHGEAYYYSMAVG